MILDDDQRELVATVRALLAKHAATRQAIDSDSGYDEKLWNLLCNQVGVAALAIPEEFGGVGASVVESNLVLEDLGAVLAATPMLGSAVLGAQALLAIGDTDACTRLLPGVAEGTTDVALCWASRTGWGDPTVTATDGQLTGTTHYVLDAGRASTFVVVTDAGFYETDTATVEVVSGMDPTRRFGQVSFDRTAAHKLECADPTAALARIRDVAITAVAAEQVGAAARCLADTVEYTKTRIQFGRPIGSFQALKHRMADLYTLVETARSASYAATQALATGAPTLSEDAAVAKVYCSEAFSAVAGEAIQLHGGVAITWEYDTHLYFKRAHGDSQLFGQPEWYVQRLRPVHG